MRRLGRKELYPACGLSGYDILYSGNSLASTISWYFIWSSMRSMCDCSVWQGLPADGTALSKDRMLLATAGKKTPHVNIMTVQKRWV